jgi:SAM-dependent methyltransferase
MLIGGELGYRLLRRFPVPRSWQARLTRSARPQPGKLEAYWGPGIWEELAGRTVIDFGCGTGADAIDIARHGARQVIGLDIVREALDVAAAAAARANVSGRCTFGTTTTVKADRILSLDSFEHFADPGGVLETMAGLLKPDGCVLVSFGPPWFHPYGGHSFSVFPWAHLLFTEQALLRWRADYCTDGATRFGEVRGGLNQMTIRRFERLIRQGPFRLMDFTAFPIRGTRLFHNGLTREFLTSMVRCRLALSRTRRRGPDRGPGSGARGQGRRPRLLADPRPLALAPPVLADP